jgi:hypothetical protein
MSAAETEIDFESAYRVEGYRGIAWRLKRYASRSVPVMCLMDDEAGNECEVESDEFDTEEDRTQVVAVMVGDDREFVFPVADLSLLGEDEFCYECGQIGCGHGRYA